MQEYTHTHTHTHTHTNILNNKKGITLIALVITIIVLLILAGVSINMLNGENSILSKAKLAREENKKSTEIEKIQLAYLAAKVTGKGKVETLDFSNELNSNFNDNEELIETTNYWYYKKYRIYKDGTIEEKEMKLPEEYQRVEYIESSGTQYIDTGLIGNYVVKLDAQGTQTTTNSQVVVGYQTATGAWLGKPNGFDTWGIGLNNRYASTIDFITRQNMSIDFRVDGLTLTIGNQTITYNYNYTPTKDRTFFLFAANNGSYGAAYFTYVKIYSTKFMQDSMLVGNFIPCYRKLDNKPGMYDLVTNTFYTNAGTGEFIVGADV